jgi:hypothetical protein
MSRRLSGPLISILGAGVRENTPAGLDLDQITERPVKYSVGVDRQSRRSREFTRDT